jgi:signal transduction histidine kinase
MADNNVNAQISSEEYKKVTEELYKQNLEVVKLYKKVEELNQELELANEGQAQLIHFINHQIKGYLGKARNIFSELLTEPGYGACTDEARPMLNEGFKDVTEGVDFVQQILRASDIEKGTFTYDMKPLDMKEIVKSEAEGKRELAEGKGLKYEINIKDGDYRTRGDTGQLKEAIKNLIDNSINYTSKGTINLQLTTDNKKILFIVKDTGMVLSNERKSRLFTKGGRDKDSLKVNINSTGFGLSIVKGIVGAHKGRVWADSLGPGQGSTFYLELPVV